jgi:hypothetical protein
MRETLPFIIISLLLAGIFFAFIPGAGAFKVLANWRRFRKNMIKAAFYPLLDYVDFNIRKEGTFFKFFGTLEAIGKKDLIWLKNGRLAVAVNLKKESVYILPSLPTDEEAQCIPWERISSLVTGTQILVAGTLYMTESGGVFSSSPEQPLLIVIYDGDKKTLMKRAIRGGRQRNEYWNPFTLISLITGAFALLFFAYVLFGNPRLYFPALLALTLSFVPIAGLLPPGVFFFFVYQYFWKRARFLRADRDLFIYPLYPFLGEKVYHTNPEALEGLVLPLPEGTAYGVSRYTREEIRTFIRQGFPLDIRQLHDNLRTDHTDEPYYLFGAFEQAEGKKIVTPRDPLLETVLIPGNPQKLAAHCNSRAMFFTILAGLAYFTGIAGNLFIIINICHHFLK